MIGGSVNADYEAVIDLVLQGPAGRTVEVEAVVDTGFNRFIALPLEIITALGALPVGSNRVLLGDGSEASLDVYGVTVLWDGVPRRVDGYVVSTTPLVGMRLLDGHPTPPATRCEHFSSGPGYHCAQREAPNRMTTGVTALGTACIATAVTESIEISQRRSLLRPRGLMGPARQASLVSRTLAHSRTRTRFCSP